MANDETIEPRDLHAKLTDGSAVLIDVRDADAFKTAHASGAINVPIGELAARLDELPAGIDIVTSCGGGTRGPRAAAQLREAGIEASVVRGGLRGWRAADLPVEGESDPN